MDLAKSPRPPPSLLVVRARMAFIMEKASKRHMVPLSFIQPEIVPQNELSSVLNEVF